MISLKRLPEPRILRERGPQWTREFLASNDPRPRSNRYRHKEIKQTLQAISFGKCFYCEQMLAEGEAEIDHYVEVAKDRRLAYAWTNLYWSCRGCIDKLPEDTIPCNTCLDPFDPDVDPSDHLTYELERILPRDGSEVGRRTIDKYCLNRSELLLARTRALQGLWMRLEQLYQRGVPYDDPRGGGAVCAAFARPERSFSAMFAARSG